MSVSQHFVTFYSPGTFVAEVTTKPIDAWDTAVALAMAKDITERHDATPYAFQFTTRTREDADLDSHVSHRSVMHYFGVKVETFAEVHARNLSNESILCDNMRINGWQRIATTTQGWKCSIPLMDDDVAL